MGPLIPILSPIAGLFGVGQDKPTFPAPPPIKNLDVAAKEEATKKAARRAAAQGRGIRGTKKTGGLGVTEDTEVTRSLLGGG